MHEIHDYVLKGGQAMTLGAMNAFRQKLPLLNVKAETIETDNFPHLPAQVRMLSRFAEDSLDGAYVPDDFPAVGETVFALGYLLKDVDIIPDSVPGSGYADDSSVVRAVLIAHEPEFRKFAGFAGIDWETITTDA